MLPLLAAGLAAPVIGGITGHLLGAGEREQAQQLIEQSVRDYESLGIPSVEAQQLALEELKSAGRLTPEMEQAYMQKSTGLADIKLDPRLKEAQYNALNTLADIGEKGGLTLSDKATLSRVQNEEAARERGSRDAILQNARARGQSGSGFELAAQLINQQGSADRSSTAGLDIAAAAEERALKSILESGNLAGNMSDQEFTRQARVKEAQDQIERFNTATKQGVGQRNVDRTNSANEANLNNDQRIADANVGTRNQQQQYNKSLLQKQFDNEMAVTAGKSNARSNQATSLQNSAQATADMFAGAGSAIGKGATAAATYQQNQDYMNRRYPTSR